MADATTRATGDEGPDTFRPVHLVGFLALSHGWTWAFWGVAGATGPSVWAWPSVAFFYVGGAGILLAGLVLTGVVHGSPGLRDLGRRLVDPRLVSARWWALTLLFYPAVAFAAAGLALTQGGVVDPLELGMAWGRLADPAGLAGMIAFVLIVGPLPEEIGWRGYLQEHLQSRGSSALVAALLVAVAWWSWHLPLFILPGYFDAFGRSSPTPLDFFMNIVPAAILYAWVYIGTDRSVLAVIVFHFMENFTSEFLGLAEAVRPWRFGLLVAVVVTVVAWAGPRTLRRGDGPGKAPG